MGAGMLEGFALVRVQVLGLVLAGEAGKGL